MTYLKKTCQKKRVGQTGERRDKKTSRYQRRKGGGIGGGYAESIDKLKVEKGSNGFAIARQTANGEITMRKKGGVGVKSRAGHARKREFPTEHD